jgi:hypothetical protein
MSPTRRHFSCREEVEVPSFVIIEVENGLTIVELAPGESPAETAVRHGGLLVDTGPYRSYEDANEALMALPEKEEPGQDME